MMIILSKIYEFEAGLATMVRCFSVRDGTWPLCRVVSWSGVRVYVWIKYRGTFEGKIGIRIRYCTYIIFYGTGILEIS